MRRVIVVVGSNVQVLDVAHAGSFESGEKAEFSFLLCGECLCCVYWRRVLT